MAYRKPASDREFAGQILSKRGTRFLKEFAALRRRIVEESIHDTRVWSRRMRSALEAFRDLLPQESWQESYGEIRRVTRALGIAREAEVMLIRLRQLGKTGDMAEGTCMEYLDEKFQKEYRREQRRMNRRLQRFKARSLRSQISRLLQGLGPGMGALPGEVRGKETKAARPAARGIQANLFPADNHSQDRAARVLAELAEPVLAFQTGRSLKRVGDGRLHRLRIDVKKLRYALEIFDESNPGALAPLITEARRFQDAAGDHQDWCVLRAKLRREIRRLTRKGFNHLSYQAGRFLEQAEERKSEARERVFPALMDLQARLRESCQGPRETLAFPQEPAQMAGGG